MLYAKQLLLFTLTLRPSGARPLCGGVHSLPHDKERTKKTCQRALPFGFPWWEALAIDISAPRQKCLSTFFLGCENDLRESNFRVGKSKDSPPTRVRWCPSFVWQKVFQPNSPLFRYARGLFALVGHCFARQFCLAK